jgi:hypothetical protein
MASTNGILDTVDQGIGKLAGSIGKRHAQGVGGSAPWVRYAGWQGAARDSTVGLFGRQAPCPLVNGSRWKVRFDPVFRMAAVTEPGPVRWMQAMA